MILFWLSDIIFYWTYFLVARAISLVFWSIRWYEKDISKLTDLYYSIFRIADFNWSGIHYTYLLFRSGFLTVVQTQRKTESAHIPHGNLQKWDLTACEYVRTDLRDKDKADSNKDEWTHSLDQHYCYRPSQGILDTHFI